MSNWKVIKTKIEVFEHPDADKLQLGKVGTYQVVVQKGLYTGGEDVIFAPEKSVLTGVLESEYKDYLAGPDRNRVKAVRLRNELSCGIIIPPHLVFEQCGRFIAELPYDEDLSELLGITKYVPEVPEEMLGLAEPVGFDLFSSNSDVEQYGVYRSDFNEGERVVVSEKLHGSQLNVYYAFDTGSPQPTIEHRWISTKNYNHLGLRLVDDAPSLYVDAVRNSGLDDMIQEFAKNLQDTYMTAMTRSINGATSIVNLPSRIVIQVFGECLPWPSHGMSYGFVEPTVRLFDVRVFSESVPYDNVFAIAPDMKSLWVPIIYDGPFSDDVKKFAKGMEQVSGKELHIKEGVVVRPYIDRRAADSTRLSVKVINSKYKETGEEVS